MIHYLYYFIPLPAESEILLTFKRRKHEELIDYGIFSQLDFAALCGDRGSNPVIVEKTTASLAEKTPVYWQKMADGMSQALIKHFGAQTSKGMRIGFILIMVVIFPI